MQKKRNILIRILIFAVIAAGVLSIFIYATPFLRGLVATTPHAAESQSGENTEGDFLTSDNVRLHYWFYNRGTEIATVFLHGGPGHSSHDFRLLQAESFADTFGSLLVFDQRGCGESQHTPDLAESMTYDRAIQDIDELREYVISGKKVVVFGRSFGGLLATHYANSNPNDVLGFILVAPGVFNVAVETEGSRQLSISDLAKSDKLGQSTIDKAITRERARVAAMYPQTTEEDIPMLSAEEQDSQGQEIYDLTSAYQSNESMLTRNDYSLLSAMADVPVLVVSGEYDLVVPPLAINEMKPYLPDATFLELPQGWHFAAYAQQETFFSAVKTFFDSLEE